MIVTEGDSITQGQWPLDLQVLLPTYEVQDIALSGAQLPDMIADFPTQALPHYNAERERNIYILYGGVNDTRGGTNAATLQSRLQTCCELALAAGFDVIVSTITPSTDYTPGEDADRVTANTWLAANYASFASPLGAQIRLVDLAALLPDPTNAAIYPDGLHPWTAAAKAIIAKAMRDAVDSLN